MILIDQVVRTDDEVKNWLVNVPQEPADQQQRHAEQTNPLVPEREHREHGLLSGAFQFNNWKMLATGQVADLKIELVTTTTANSRLRFGAR